MPWPYVFQIHDTILPCPAAHNRGPEPLTSRNWPTNDDSPTETPRPQGLTKSATPYYRGRLPYPQGPLQTDKASHTHTREEGSPTTASQRSVARNPP